MHAFSVNITGQYILPVTLCVNYASQQIPESLLFASGQWQSLAAKKRLCAKLPSAPTQPGLTTHFTAAAPETQRPNMQA